MESPDQSKRNSSGGSLYWNDIEKVKVDPHKFLIFTFSTESEEWMAFITLWNHDFDYSYKFQIKSNKINDKECFIIRPRGSGVLDKQSGFGKRIVLKVTYDLTADEPSTRYSKTKATFETTQERFGQVRALDRIFDLKETRRYFQLCIWKNTCGEDKSKSILIRQQFLLPVFFCPQMTNTEVFVYPEKSITFNRNQGNQFSYWKNNLFIINNSSRILHFRVLITKLPNNCDMVIFPTKGSVQHSFSDYRPGSSDALVGSSESDQHYTPITVLLLHPEKAYMTHTNQKPIATIVLLFSYQRHPDSDHLEDLLQWANCKETIDVFVRDVSHNVVKDNNKNLKSLMDLAKQNTMEPVYNLFRKQDGSNHDSSFSRDKGESMPEMGQSIISQGQESRHSRRLISSNSSRKFYAASTESGENSANSSMASHFPNLLSKDDSPGNQQQHQQVFREIINEVKLRASRQDAKAFDINSNAIAKEFEARGIESVFFAK